VRDGAHAVHVVQQDYAVRRDEPEQRVQLQVVLQLGQVQAVHVALALVRDGHHRAGLARARRSLQQVAPLVRQPHRDQHRSTANSAAEITSADTPLKRASFVDVYLQRMGQSASRPKATERKRSVVKGAAKGGVKGALVGVLVGEPKKGAVVGAAIGAARVARKNSKLKRRTRTRAESRAM
jgi:hypothetical protein